MTGKSCVGCKVATLLAGIGALNWGLYGVFGINLVARLLGDMTTAAKVVYGLIGVAGLMKLASLVVQCPCNRSSGNCETKK